ncbi:MAG: hypothetical protein J1G01_06060 [Clostridiales bacterium]|nr:hypothetical protein [Clostridiales bacterium]
MKTNAFKKSASIIVALVWTALSVFALCACSLFGDEEASVWFTRGGLTLQVGDSYNLSDIIESDAGSYTLSSSNAAVASISGRYVTAHAVGVTTVTVSTAYDSDTLKVTVVERRPDTITIETTGNLIQTVGEFSAITFTPTLTGSIASSNIKWTVNGQNAKTLAPDDSFSFTPERAGIFVIRASAGTAQAEITVRAFYAVRTTVVCDGEKTQLDAPYSALTFTVNVESHSDNPDNYIVLYEDDSVVYSGYELELSYTPTPGRHTISVDVNGKRAYSTDVFIRGAVVPSAPTVEFDNVFPHIYIVYDAKGDALVEITSPTGAVSTYSQNDAQYAERFSERGFDAQGLIALCATGGGRKSYRIRVCSLGDGEALTRSEFSGYYAFTQLPSNAKRFIETRCLDSDLYVTSANEYVAIAEYYINFRTKTGATSKVSFDCYIAYELDGNADDLWNDAFPLAATSGMYSKISVTMSNNVMNTSFSVNTVNNPSKQSRESLLCEYPEQLHAILPHINYDDSKYRDEDYIFPIDNSEYEGQVQYSDELYLTAQRGVKPVPVRGSAAEILYEKARAVLREICTDDMTDVQKAHAIYDWIMWQVSYDIPAAESTTEVEKYSAYYLEGVFGDGVTQIGGVVYSPYAVCDGMSKAYALMCNIEGIPCVRVVGEAGSSLAAAGGHAWNKVFVNGNWYVVDCTWGDSQGELVVNGARNVYELGLHDYLFVTDAQISSTHFEPYRTGETSIVYAPTTARTPLDVYSEMTFNGVAVNCLIAKGENQTERLREVAKKCAAAYEKKTSVNIIGGTNNGVYDIDYQGVEIRVQDKLSLSDNNIYSIISSAVRSVNSKLEIKIAVFDNIILLLLR